MLELQGNKKERSAVSADFQTALTQQVLRTELIRIKALIGTMVLLAVLVLIIDTLYPYAVEHLWHGRLRRSIFMRSWLPSSCSSSGSIATSAAF